MRLLRTSLNAGTAENVTNIANAWEAHFLNIQTKPNLQEDFLETWLPYDVTLRKTYICPGQSFNPAVEQQSVLAAVERDSLKCKAAETLKLVQMSISTLSARPKQSALTQTPYSGKAALSIVLLS